MDYQASKSCSKEISSAPSKKLLSLILGVLSCTSFVSAQTTTTNPLTEDIVIYATVLVDPNTKPDTPPTPPSPPGPIPPSTDSAIFKGMAYQGSTVTLLKNGDVIATVPANPDGSFDLRVHGLPMGTYSFGVRAEDSNHLVSKLVLFTVYVASGVTTVVEGIFIPPTITSDKVEVKRGEPISFSGTSIANADVLVSLTATSELLKKIRANASGTWTYTMSSSLLDFGDYDAKARTITASSLSLYSDPITFRVGDVTRLRTKPGELLGFRRRCDLNNDNRVNLLDFSIMAFWYKRLGFPEKVDLNTDKSVNLTDLSILAYCWTG